MRQKIARTVRVGAREIAVPRADLVADVAAEDPVAEFRPQVARNRATIFDGLVRDAEIGAHHITVRERASRTEIDTSPPGAAMPALNFRPPHPFDLLQP